MKRETRPGFRPKETYFDWDVQDRLVRVSLPDGARWRYRYDAFGRRINKVREGQLPSAQAVARVAYRWDGDQLIGQQQYYADGSAAREVQWVYEPGSFRPLAQVEAQGDSTQLHYIVTDLTGTARELCSEEGEVRWRGEQGLWGAHREERRPIPLRRYLGDAANEEVYCELRYQGQLYDAETGLYYNRHRYYDAESGQYLSPDPIGLLGGRRPQGYVHNPLEWVDPLGLAACPDLYDWYKYNRSKGMNASEAHAAIKNASPQEIFDYSLHRQGLSGQDYPINFKEKFSAGNYKYEVRAHDVNPNAPLGSNSANGPIFRVGRSQMGVNPSTNQGYGWEYGSPSGGWHHTSILKPTSPNYNPAAANDTHIPLPNGIIP